MTGLTLYAFLVDQAICGLGLSPEIRATAIARLDRAVEAVFGHDGRIVARPELERIAERIARDAHHDSQTGRLERVVPAEGTTP